MDRSLPKILKYLLCATVAGVLLYYSFRDVNWSDFVAGLKACDWPFVILSMLCGVAAFWFKGMRWTQMLRPVAPGVKYLDTYDAVTVGNLSNIVFPFLGDFVRAGYVRRNSAGKYDRALGTVALERVWDLLFVFILMALLVILKWEEFGGFVVERLWRPAIDRFDLAVWIALAILVLLAAAFVAAVVFLHARNSFLGRVHNACSGLAQGFVSVFRMDRKLLFLVGTALIWTMYWLQIVCLFHAFPPASGLGPDDALFIMLVGSLASFVPVPGGFGAYHYLVAFALSSMYGLPWQAGIVFATIAHESQAITMTVTGLLSVIRQELSGARR